MEIEEINNGHYWLFNDVKYYIKHPMHDFRGQIIRLGNIKIPGAQDLTADNKKLFLENEGEVIYFIEPSNCRFDL
jgi:hypothetical protein